MDLPWHKRDRPMQPKPPAPAFRPDGHQVEYTGLLMDRSPSMGTSDYLPSRLEAAKEAVLAFYSAKYGIDPRDKVATLAFDAGCQEVAGFGTPAVEVWRKVDAIRTGDATAIGVAMERGLTLLEQHAPKDYVRRLVILSDGATNTGVHPRRLIPRCQQDQVIVDTVGIGSPSSADYRDGEPLLREIATATGGAFVYCRDVASLIASYRELAKKKLGPAIVTVRPRPGT